MFSRLATSRLLELARQFPAVLILGARQVGKTTLIRAAFPDIPYCDLEDPATRDLFTAEPRYQLEQRAEPAVILDEAQSVPDVFPALRGAIDAARSRMGRFLILGSAQPTLVRHISESLAGRVGILELDPLTALEIAMGNPPIAWQQLWLCGGYPDAVLAAERGGRFRDWCEAYLRTYVERDLPALGLGASPVLLRRLLTMLAHGQGGIANVSRLASALGVSGGTVNRYLDILEQTFLIRRLTPYHRNVGKRLVKSPKLYIRDTGLLHHLLGIDSHEGLLSHPVRGASWETFVIEDLIRRERLRNPYSTAHFWRTASGAEVDLVIQRSSSVELIEVKTADGVSPHLGRTLRAVGSDLGVDHISVVNQADDVRPLVPGVELRGFAVNLSWLP